MKTTVLKPKSQLWLRMSFSILILTVLLSCSKDPIELEKETQQSTNATTKYTGPPEYTGDCSSTIYAYPECFGAQGNGTHDDTNAIRQAIATGKTVVFSKKTYLVSTFDFGDDPATEPIGALIGALFAFDLPNNTTILGQGDDSILKIADNSVNDQNKHSGCLFQANGKTNITLRGFKIDMNGPNNLVPNHAISMNQGIVYAFFGYQATNVTIDQLKIVDNPGKNGIVFWKGSNNTITNNWLINGGTSITPSDPQLSTNKFQDDYSAIYVNSSNSIIKWNKIKHDRFPYYYSGGIELHAAGIQCEENYIERSYPACFIFADSTNSQVDNCTFKYNGIFDCYGGITIGGNGGSFNNLDISQNNIYLRTNLFSLMKNGLPVTQTELSYAITQNDKLILPGGTQEVTTITNSNFSNNTVYDNDPLTLPTYKSIFFRIRNSNGLTVNQNTIHKTSGATFMMGSDHNGKIMNLTIDNNDIKYFGANTSSNHHYAFILGAGVNGAENVYITNNKINLTNPYQHPENNDTIQGNEIYYYPYLIDFNENAPIINFNVNNNSVLSSVITNTLVGDPNDFSKINF